MKNLIFTAMIAVMCCVTSCYHVDYPGLLQGHKLDPDEVVSFKKVTKQEGEVIWLANGEIYASSKFEGLSLEGKEVSCMGTRPIIHRRFSRYLGTLYFEGYEVLSLINEGHATIMKVVTPLKSKIFGMRTFVFVYDEANERTDMIRANIYQMVEKN